MPHAIRRLKKMLEVKVKLIHPDAELPKQAKPGDAGFDVKAVSKELIIRENYSYIEYKTGLCFEIPEGYAGFMFERSSISKTNLILANCVGVIDSGFRGEVTFRFKLFGSMAGTYDIGDRIGQLVIMPIPKVKYTQSDTLSETERGKGAYGHSGR
jgi:dUTP pyrophosphatase